MWLTPTISWLSVKEITFNNMDETHPILWRPDDQKLRFPGEEEFCLETVTQTFSWRFQPVFYSADFRLKTPTSTLTWVSSLLARPKFVSSHNHVTQFLKISLCTSMCVYVHVSYWFYFSRELWLIRRQITSLGAPTVCQESCCGGNLSLTNSAKESDTSCSVVTHNRLFQTSWVISHPSSLTLHDVITYLNATSAQGEELKQATDK